MKKFFVKYILGRFNDNVTVNYGRQSRWWFTTLGLFILSSSLTIIWSLSYSTWINIIITVITSSIIIYLFTLHSRFLNRLAEFRHKLESLEYK